MTENIVEVPAIDAVNEQYRVYGEYVDLHRHIPYLFDGLKPSYRRVIQATLEIARDKLVKTAKIVGHTIGNFHPHGDASIEPLVSELVHAGIFEGKGNHGAEQLVGMDLPPAAVRYTEAKLSNNYKTLLSPILGEIPTFINEFGNKEFEYIPTPIPFGMLFGYLGIGIGTGCRIPAFTAESLLDAYLNNDYRLLKNANGVEITNLDPYDSYDEIGNKIKLPSRLEDLWHTGSGRINYKMDVSENYGVITIKGSKGPLKLNWDWFLDMRGQGRVEINELTSSTPIVEISKAPRVQWPSYEEIYEHVINMTQGGESYYIRAVYNNQVRDIGIYDWIDITYKNYKRIYKNSIDKLIEKYKWDIEIYSNFRRVADLIINRKDLNYSDIAKELNVKEELVDSIGRKSINTLRNSDPIYKVNELEEEIDRLNNFDIDKLIKDNINLM